MAAELGIEPEASHLKCGFDVCTCVEFMIPLVDRRLTLSNHLTSKKIIEVQCYKNCIVNLVKFLFKPHFNRRNKTVLFELRFTAASVPTIQAGPYLLPNKVHVPWVCTTEGWQVLDEYQGHHGQHMLCAY